jgi:hypothetical protein
MTWHAIWEKKPKYNQKVLVADPSGWMQIMKYKGKLRGTTANYKFAKITRPEIYYTPIAREFRWTEIDSEPVFD